MDSCFGFVDAGGEQKKKPPPNGWGRVLEGVNGFFFFFFLSPSTSICAPSAGDQGSKKKKKKKKKLPLIHPHQRNAKVRYCVLFKEPLFYLGIPIALLPNFGASTHIFLCPLIWRDLFLPPPSPHPIEIAPEMTSQIEFPGRDGLSGSGAPFWSD